MFNLFKQRCPNCGSNDLAQTFMGTSCISCGHTWDSVKRNRRITAKWKRDMQNMETFNEDEI